MGGMLVLLPFAAWEFVQADTPAWTPLATLLVVAAWMRLFPALAQRDRMRDPHPADAGHPSSGG